MPGRMRSADKETSYPRAAYVALLQAEGAENRGARAHLMESILGRRALLGVLEAKCGRRWALRVQIKGRDLLHANANEAADSVITLLAKNADCPTAAARQDNMFTHNAGWRVAKNAVLCVVPAVCCLRCVPHCYHRSAEMPSPPTKARLPAERKSKNRYERSVRTRCTTQPVPSSQSRRTKGEGAEASPGPVAALLGKGLTLGCDSQSV